MTRMFPALGTTIMLLLAGCDGTAVSGSTRPDTAEGLWNGVFSISTDSTPDNRRFHALVTADGKLWLAYTQSGSSALAGVVQGSGSSDSGAHSYVAASVTERNAGLALSGPLAALYTAQSKFGGTITTNTGTLRTLSFNPGNAVDYDLSYEQGPATLPAVAQALSGTGVAEGGTVTVALQLDASATNPDQVLTVQIGSGLDICHATSPVTPAGTGNYFTLTLTFLGGTACSNRGLSGSVAGVLFRNDNGKTVLVTTGSSFGFLED